MRTMKEPQDRYSSYLLRLWQTATDGERDCRVSLESADSGERVGFPNLEALISFLRRECRVVSRDRRCGRARRSLKDVGSRNARPER